MKLELSKVRRNIPVGASVKLLLSFSIFFTLGAVSNLRTLGSMPLEENPIIVKEVKEPQKAEEVRVPEVQSARIIAQKVDPSPEPKKTSVCKDVDESWKLVPNPEEEGLYVICNANTDSMAGSQELNNALNNYRSALGLNKLTINEQLCNAADRRAKEVASNFSHNGFEQAIKDSGLQKSSFGENIASGPMSAVRFVEWSWDKSPGHRENMRRDWTDGCGGVYDRYAVFLFAK